MNKLTEHNKEVLENYKKLIEDEHIDLSSPLLVSSDNEYLSSLKRKIMYIGQETNGWVNYKKGLSEITSKKLEEEYYNFLKNKTYKSPFWKFIKESLEQEEVASSIIWSNIFICGNKIGYGKPARHEKLLDMSKENLIFLNDFFNPEYTLFVCGPTSPYYVVVDSFLEYKDSSLLGRYPSKSSPVIYDDKNNIIWTYHPGYLRRKNLYEETKEKIKILIK